MPVCTVVSSRSGIIYNPSADAITDYSQSADIDPYFKSQLHGRSPKAGTEWAK